MMLRNLPFWVSGKISKNALSMLFAVLNNIILIMDFTISHSGSPKIKYDKNYQIHFYGIVLKTS